MENTTPEVNTSIELDHSAYMNTLISKVTKCIGQDGALHLLCVLNGADPTVMATLANQLKEANKL